MVQESAAAAMLAAMTESGAFDDTAQDDVVAADWLSSLPDHIRNADFGQPGVPTVVDDPAPHAAQSNTPEGHQSRLLTIEQMLAAQPTHYVVADLLPERGLMVIYGAPAAGKTFLAIDLAFAIGAGRAHWFGRRLVQAPVAYVALEGKGGMRRRIQACLAHTGDDVTSGMRFFTDRLSLLERAVTERLAEEIRIELGAGTVTVIDTLSRATPGGDENSSIDMTTAIEHAELLGSIVKGPVIIVHHTGKEPGKGLRGHSSLLGAVDVSMEVLKSNGTSSWTLKKNKDGEDGGVYAFELVSYPVGTDQWGDELRSCAVRQLLGAPKPSLPAVTGKNRIAVMAAVRQAIVAEPAGISWNRTIEIAATAITASGGRRNTVAKATLNGLVVSGHLHHSNGDVILP